VFVLLFLFGLVFKSLVCFQCQSGGGKKDTRRRCDSVACLGLHLVAKCERLLLRVSRVTEQQIESNSSARQSGTPPVPTTPSNFRKIVNFKRAMFSHVRLKPNLCAVSVAVSSVASELGRQQVNGRHNEKALRNIAGCL
jgi:hypothetical protein